MSLHRPAKNTSLLRFPRVSGDEPSKEPTFWDAYAFSPRERG